MAVFQIIYTHSRLTEPWQGFSDITGGFGNTGIFGGFVAMGFVAALGLLLSSKQFAIRIFLCVLLIPISIQLFYTQSRAAWLAAIIGTAVLLLFPVFRKLKKPKVTIAIVFGLIICALLLLISLYYFKKDSADGRVLIWTVSAKMLTEKPITGFGVDGFQKNYLLRQGEYFKNNPDSTFADLADNSHSTFNEWLKIGVEQGIIGLLFVIGILFMAFRYSAHSPSLWAIMAALFVFSCFSYPFEFMAFKILAVFCLADIQSPVLFGTQITQIDTKYFLAKVNLRLHKLGLCRFSIVSICVIALRRTLFRVICVPLIISACGFTIYFSHNYFSGIKEWNRAYYAYSSEEKTDKLQALYPDLKRNAMFVSVYGKALYDNERYSEAIPILEKAKKLFPATQTFILLGDAYEKTGAYSEALDVWQTASYIMPVLFTPHYNMAKLYQKLDDNERAKQKAELILNKRIKINSPRIVRMKREMEVLMNN
jgi:tetratricopeptide (TPR) repeat protein